MRARAFIFLLVLAASSVGFAHAELPLPLRDGERLTYRVSWAILPGAGEIHIAAQREGDSRLVVTSNTATRGLVKAIMRFKAEAQATFDLKTGRWLSLWEKSEQRNKQAEHSVNFDYQQRQATYAPADAPDKARVLPMPEGDPRDLIMALLQTRTWDLKPGEKRDALVLFDDDFYELTIYAVRYEDVKIPMGTYKTLVLEPRMEKTPPKGMFRRGGSVRVWISQDEQQLPVKFEVEFKIGTGMAVLESYESPASAKARGISASRPGMPASVHATDPRP